MTDAPAHRYDVFLSYGRDVFRLPSEREQWIRQFEDRLRRELQARTGRDVSVFSEMQMGDQDWAQTFAEAVRTSACLVALPSPDWLGSAYQLEPFFAGRDDALSRTFVVQALPFEASLPFGLDRIQWISFIGPSGSPVAPEDPRFSEPMGLLADLISKALPVADPGIRQDAAQGAPSPSPQRAEPAPTASAATPPPGPRAWLFYAAADQWAASWIEEFQPGRIDFWRHGSSAYTRQMAVGDTVVVLIGQPGISPPDGDIVALGVLAADRTVRFDDPRPNQQTRRWPIVCWIKLQAAPIRRSEIEKAAGAPLVPRQGAVHELRQEAIEAINRQLAARDTSARIPLPADVAQRALASSEPLADALRRYEFLQVAELPPWPPTVGRPSLPDATPGAPEPQAKEEEHEGEPAPDEPEATPKEETGAYVPFISDAPSESEDTLDRGPLALFLGRRLHLIWREVNGLSPGPPPKRRAHRSRSGQEAETFIVHIDAPWGGGKTTFANFLARVLDPTGETLTARHFLRASLAPGVEEKDLAAVKLGKVFLGDAEPAAGDDAPGHRPWIVVWTNAWRDQYIDPPWWQLFLAISTDVRRSVGADVQAGLQAALKGKASGLRTAADALSRWLGIALAGVRYRLFNTKLIRQFVLTLLGIGLLFVLRSVADADTVTKLGGDPSKVKAWIDIGLVAVTLFGGGLAALGTLFSQSLAPDIDFSDESKRIGVRDPIARFRRTFDRILSLGRRPVLLVVDDLDRCEPSRVVEILRGFQTIVRSSQLFVLVLGDRRWIEQAHTVWHKDLSGLNVGPETPLGARFVEKLFQLSFTLPAMKAEARDRYTLANLSRGDAAPARGAAARTMGVAAPRAAVAPDLIASVQRVASGTAAVPQKERALNDLLEKSGLEGETLAAAQDVAARQLVVATGADAGYQQQVRNILTGLAGSLPNNPRQIKRIFNAFAVYETVGRLYFRYQVGAGQGDEVHARRWRQLALWVTLSTDWPETWRRIARRPELLEAAYAATPKAQKAAEKSLADGLSEEGVADLAATLRRLRNDDQLRGLLAGDGTAPAGADPAALFAATALEPAAVYEFNRIMWEPDFPLSP